MRNGWPPRVVYMSYEEWLRTLAGKAADGAIGGLVGATVGEAVGGPAGLAIGGAAGAVAQAALGGFVGWARVGNKWGGVPLPEDEEEEENGDN